MIGLYMSDFSVKPATVTNQGHRTRVSNLLSTTMPPSRVKRNLEQLKEEYLNSSWFRFNVVEPRIGDIECLALAEEYGPRGQSCYIVFVTNRGSGNYGCIEDHCVAFSAKTVEAALRHQRAYHFGHNPFICIPNSGALWYVFLIGVYH